MKLQSIILISASLAFGIPDTPDAQPQTDHSGLSNNVNHEHHNHGHSEHQIGSSSLPKNVNHEEHHSHGHSEHQTDDSGKPNNVNNEHHNHGHSELQTDASGTQSNVNLEEHHNYGHSEHQTDTGGKPAIVNHEGHHHHSHSEHQTDSSSLPKNTNHEGHSNQGLSALQGIYSSHTFYVNQGEHHSHVHSEHQDIYSSHTAHANHGDHHDHDKVSSSGSSKDIDHSAHKGHEQHQDHAISDIPREEKFFLFTPNKGLCNQTLMTTLARHKYCNKDDDLIMNMYLYPDAAEKGFTFYPNQAHWDTFQKINTTKLDLSLSEDKAKALKLTNIFFQGKVNDSNIIQFPIKVFSPQGFKGEFDLIFQLNMTCGNKEPFVSMETTCPHHPSPSILMSSASTNIPLLLPLLLIMFL
ncbi:hypothetical protein DSO57_1003363 [Entomophthora muscae]|uniref:Uncharacterized protein n=1 Tax=Entomophthora muscae TaxID=34485 RepID=A0ACC2SXD7_9FUNG|nr:hypothetical protein DSO57_1003363 [Entomophthora muscae]